MSRNIKVFCTGLIVKETELELLAVQNWNNNDKDQQIKSIPPTNVSVKPLLQQIERL